MPRRPRHIPTTNPELYVSPAQALMNNGIAVIDSLDMLDSLKPPVRLTMALLAVCVKGEVSAVVDLERMSMGPSSIIVLSEGHQIDRISQSADFSGFFILGSRSRIEEIVPLSATYLNNLKAFFHDDPAIVEVSQAELDTLIALHSALRCKTLSMNRPYNSIVFNALCEALFFDTLGIYTMHIRRTASGSAGQHIPSHSEELLSRFLALVDNHYISERSVNFYARILNLSAKHLSTTVKRASGETASYWIDSKVIHEAKMLLRNSPRTVQEVSIMLNFPSQSIFGKFFKRHTGKSPSAWRAALPD